MRHLKKFNESIEEGLDIEYIKFCFIDMVEADKEVGEITYWNKVSDIGAMNQIEDRDATSENVNCVIIFVICPQLNIKHTPDGFKGSISQFVEYNKAFLVFLDELEANIERLKEEHPDYVVETTFDQLSLIDQIQGKDYFVIEIKK
jgi:hypothetical protein